MSCVRCSGTGYVQGQCGMCGGAGFFEDEGIEEDDLKVAPSTSDCGVCHGTGTMPSGCPDCSGSGYTEEDEDE